MYVHTATTERKNVYTTTFRSEYLIDVLNAVTEMENDYQNERKHIEQLESNIDMDAADCLYYTMVVTYYTTCEKTAAFAARLVEIAADNEAWAAAHQLKATSVAAAAEVAAEATIKPKKAIVVNGVHVENAGFHAPGFTCNVGKFVKSQWNNETEDDMWYWIRCNQTKFPEYANALRAVLGEEHDKLDWHGLDEE